MLAHSFAPTSNFDDNESTVLIEGKAGNAGNSNEKHHLFCGTGRGFKHHNESSRFYGQQRYHV